VPSSPCLAARAPTVGPMAAGPGDRFSAKKTPGVAAGGFFLFGGADPGFGRVVQCMCLLLQHLRRFQDLRLLVFGTENQWRII